MRRPMPWKPQKVRRPSQDKGARWRGAFGKLKQAHAEDNTALSLCERALAGKVGGDALRRELRTTFKELSASACDDASASATTVSWASAPRPSATTWSARWCSRSAELAPSTVYEGYSRSPRVESDGRAHGDRRRGTTLAGDGPAGRTPGLVLMLAVAAEVDLGARARPHPHTVLALVAQRVALSVYDAGVEKTTLSAVGSAALLGSSEVSLPSLLRHASAERELIVRMLDASVDARAFVSGEAVG